jgi:hypothetical protein
MPDERYLTQLAPSLLRACRHAWFRSERMTRVSTLPSATSRASARSMARLRASAARCSSL